MYTVILITLIAVIIQMCIAPSPCCDGQNQFNGGTCSTGSPTSITKVCSQTDASPNDSSVKIDSQGNLITKGNVVPPHKYCFTMIEMKEIFIICLEEITTLNKIITILNSHTIQGTTRMFSAFFLLATFCLHVKRRNDDFAGVILYCLATSCILNLLQGIAQFSNSRNCTITDYYIYLASAFFVTSWTSLTHKLFDNITCPETSWTILKLYNVICCFIPGLLLATDVKIYVDLLPTECFLQNVNKRFSLLYLFEGACSGLNAGACGFCLRTTLVCRRQVLSFRQKNILGYVCTIAILILLDVSTPHGNIFRIIVDICNCLHGVVVFIILGHSVKQQNQELQSQKLQSQELRTKEQQSQESTTGKSLEPLL